MSRIFIFLFVFTIMTWSVSSYVVPEGTDIADDRNSGRRDLPDALSTDLPEEGYPGRRNVPDSLSTDLPKEEYSGRRSLFDLVGTDEPDNPNSGRRDLLDSLAKDPLAFVKRLLELVKKLPAMLKMLGSLAGF